MKCLCALLAIAGSLISVAAAPPETPCGTLCSPADNIIYFQLEQCSPTDATCICSTTARFSPPCLECLLGLESLNITQFGQGCAAYSAPVTLDWTASTTFPAPTSTSYTSGCGDRGRGTGITWPLAIAGAGAAVAGLLQLA